MRFQANEWTARSLPLMTWIEHGGVFDARIEAEV